MSRPTHMILAFAIVMVTSALGGNDAATAEAARLAGVAQSPRPIPPSAHQPAHRAAQTAKTAPEEAKEKSIKEANEPEALWRGLKTLVGRLLGSQRRQVAYITRAQIAMFEMSLELFRLDTGDYPSTAQGLGALRTAPADLANPDKWAGPYLGKPVPLDPWDNPYQYQYPGKHDPKKPDIWSFGPDGVDGTEDDIVSWVEPGEAVPGRHGARPVKLSQVDGTIILDGEPLANATIEFQPSGKDSGGPSFGETDPNGHYELMYTYDHKGALPGEHVVRITTGREVEDERGKIVVIEERLPAKYNVKSVLRVTVERGTNTIDFDLTSE